ncbi:UBX domain-containing protein 10 [Acanthopagrus latus]|uniref:UBX domain-containing protein 10 n=1 Tax=Acanthopagrus latus TaxID=8177 RepID=UPI00187CF651|nr:UBX domain-containing protein 10 [Acanthopagrus latus]
MHLTRPKSSKGRSRPALNSAGDAGGIQRTPVSPESPVHRRRPEGALRSQSQPIMWQTGQLSQDEVLQMLHHTPAAPPQSLNKYKVLPSIERRQSEVRSLDHQMSQLSLSHGAILQQGYRHDEPDLPSSSEEVDSRPKTPGPAPVMTKGATGSLLLAIRAPCGGRFQQHFDPTDTLLTVRASAEVKFGARYGDACIETMDVPRRTFTDMDVTLAQCGVVNRSVLCISHSDSVVEHQ